MSVKFANFYIAAMQNFLLWLYAGSCCFNIQRTEKYAKTLKINYFFIPLIGNSADKTSDRLLGSVKLTK